MRLLGACAHSTLLASSSGTEEDASAWRNEVKLLGVNGSGPGDSSKTSANLSTAAWRSKFKKRAQAGGGADPVWSAVDVQRVERWCTAKSRVISSKVCLLSCYHILC